MTEFNQQDARDVMEPSHYNTGDIECIDGMQACSTPEQFREHCRLTAFKYLWRANYKQTREKDLRKAIFYLHLAVGDEPREDRSWYKGKDQI